MESLSIIQINQIKDSLNRIESKLDALLQNTTIPLSTCTYKDMTIECRYVTVPFEYEDGEIEENEYTVVSNPIAKLIYWGIDNEEPEALAWDEGFWFSVSTHELKTFTDEDLIQMIRKINSY